MKYFSREKNRPLAHDSEQYHLDRAGAPRKNVGVFPARETVCMPKCTRARAQELLYNISFRDNTPIYLRYILLPSNHTRVLHGTFFRDVHFFLLVVIYIYPN